MLPSTGSAGDSFDDAMAESFFATLARELIHWRSFQARAETRMALFEFLEGWGQPTPSSFRPGRPPSQRLPTRRGKGNAPWGAQRSSTDSRGPRCLLERPAGQPALPSGESSPSFMEKTLLPPAIAHCRAGADSHQVSTKTG